jgi:hypothetical protein
MQRLVAERRRGCSMIRNRTIHGSEITEVAITAVVMLCLAIGVVAVFGGNLQKIFQNENSPTLMAAKMKDSTDTSDPTGANSRTNIDKNLITNQFITKSHSDLSLGSEVGLETTGTAGGDSQIGGTYIVDNPDALYDGDPSTTGNTLLDAALAAKKAASELFSQSKSAINLAEIYNKKAQNLNDKAKEQEKFLKDIEKNVTSLANEVGTVGTHLDLLVHLKATSEGIATNIATALDLTNGINTNIINLTNQNILNGQSLLDLNQQQITAYNDYLSLQSSYDAGWSTCTDPVTGDTYSCNTSSVSTTDINSALNTANQLLQQVNGQASGIQNTVSSLEPVVDSMEDAADDAEKSAEDLEKEARNTLKEAFYDSSIFDDNDTVQQMAYKAFKALSVWGKPVKNIAAAYKAIDLLKAAGEAYKEAKHLKAKAHKNKEHMKQLQKTLDELAANASNVALSANQVNTTNILQTQSAQLTALAQADPSITMVSSELTKVQNATLAANNQLILQQTELQSLITESVNASNLAQDTINSANALNTDAQTALNEAQATIDTLVTYPNP